MCGIAGIFSKLGPIDREAIARATSVLHHRGPDGRKHWYSISAAMALGHTRLSIIDLTTGDQPISNEDGSICIVVNGEVYEHDKLRRDLQSKGHVFKTKSDSEVILHLYEEYGAQCLHYLRGEYAFIIWDEKSQSLFAARDRFGIKPLFYAVHNDKIYLASEVKALFAAGVPSLWDRDSFFHVLSYLNYPADRSPFEGVQQVPPGHYLIANRRYHRVFQYWDHNYPVEIAEPQSEQALIEELRFLLDDAVRVRLQADVPVGVYLSGGIDSIAILGLAARQSQQPLQTFTMAFEDKDYDESTIAKEAAALAGAQYNQILVRPSDLADNFSDAIWHTETLPVSSSFSAKFMLSKIVRDAGYKVILSGEGSDDLFAGYPHFRRDTILYGTGAQNSKSAGEVKAMLKNLEDSNKTSSGLMMPRGETVNWGNLRKILGFVPSWIEAQGTLAMRVRSLLRDDVQPLFKNRDATVELINEIDVFSQLKGRAPLNQSMYLFSKTDLANYILSVMGDRIEMAHSVEGRVPFLDHHVVEFVTQRVPVNFKIRGLVEKYILKEAVRDVIPESVYKREKHTFLAPPSTTNPNGKLHQLIQDRLRSDAFSSVPFYDQKKVIALLDSVPSMTQADKTAIDFNLIQILGACFMQERFNLS